MLNILLIILVLAIFALVYILAGRFDHFLAEFIRTGRIPGKGGMEGAEEEPGRRPKGEIEKEINRIVDAFHDRKIEEEFDERIARTIIDDPGYIECTDDRIHGK